jgi:putative transposase
MRRLIVKLARETGWGYTRILGELKKLGTCHVSRNTVRNILLAHGLDPGPRRGVGTWDEFLKIHAATLWQCDFVDGGRKRRRGGSVAAVEIGGAHVCISEG